MGREFGVGNYSPPLTICSFKVHFSLGPRTKKILNFHHLFMRVSLKYPTTYIITSTHYVELGTQRAMGSLWGGPAATESKVLSEWITD